MPKKNRTEVGSAPTSQPPEEKNARQAGPKNKCDHSGDEPTPVNGIAPPDKVATDAIGEATSPLAATGSDLSDMSRFRLSQNFADAVQVVKRINTVPVRKPHKQEFVRSSDKLVFETVTFTTTEDGRLYLVEPGLIDSFPEQLRPTLLVGTMNRQAVFYFWPIFLQQGDEPWNQWHRSAFNAMTEARQHWVRVSSNRSLGAYEVHLAMAPGLPDPEWPELSLNELLKIAFRDHIIDSSEHPILKMLRGEI